MDDPRKIFTLSDIGRSLRSVIERNYTNTYWIKAEIAKLNYYPRSGHCYPELVDKSGSVIQAQMRATVWASDFERANKEFIKVTGETIKEGLSILFRASVVFHPVYGLSLQVHEIEPAFTLGEMALEKSKTIEKLRNEGVFDQNKQLFLPLLPKKVAVISVETSKGYHDFLKIIQSQSSKYSVWHYLFPSILQGEKAVEGIISQLRIIKKVSDRFDLVTIIRGGGGDIGLSCYDDYKLAREVATFPLPVITGIGHSTNETITEMVAWANKITPTDVAYFLLGKFNDFETRIENAAKILNSELNTLLFKEKQNLRQFSSDIFQGSSLMLNRSKVLLDNRQGSLMDSVKLINREQSGIITDLGVRLSIIPSRLLIRSECHISAMSNTLQMAVANLKCIENNRIDSLSNKTELLNPSNILKRGYSITFKGGRVIKDTRSLKKDDVLQTQFYKGKIESVVIKSTHKHD
ncbi:MAG: exodeoxyribonuclease VII large subunit [Bacteroidetes bacterium]|nr:MAG: exodeoxyribonuclease VII large subunit [Bacteroidota bacterium]